MSRQLANDFARRHGSVPGLIGRMSGLRPSSGAPRFRIDEPRPELAVGVSKDRAFALKCGRSFRIEPLVLDTVGP